jgi:hypothetical protein
VALDEVLVEGEAGHTAAHAALKADYIARGGSSAAALPDYPGSYGTVHNAIHGTLHADFNASGGLPGLPSIVGATGHLAHHAALAKALNVRQAASAGGGVFRNLDFDTSERQALDTHPWSEFQVAQPHQTAWVTSPTRLGSGHAERFEIHNEPGDILNGQSYRSMMDVYDTNDGGDTVGPVVGYPKVYWCCSVFYPTQAVNPALATVTPGFAQIQAPDYTSMFELHERANVNGSTVGINDLKTVTNHAMMIRWRDGVPQLQYRGCNGTFTWNAGAGAWDQPSWSLFTPGTTGKNDQIGVPIVKPGGTNPTFVMDDWVDFILGVEFSKTASGKVEVWARQRGQAFTTSPTLTINGPTHKVAVGSDGVTRSSADYEDARGSYGGTGLYAHIGVYPGSTTWEDAVNGAHVAIFDECRRYGTLAEAMANWGGGASLSGPVATTVPTFPAGTNVFVPDPARTSL